MPVSQGENLKKYINKYWIPDILITKFSVQDVRVLAQE
jgi:hypothetical protein